MHKQTIPIKIPIKTIAEFRGKNKHICTVLVSKRSQRILKSICFYDVTRFHISGQTTFVSAVGRGLANFSYQLQQFHHIIFSTCTCKVRVNMNIARVLQPSRSPASAVCIPCERCWPCCSLTFPNMAACVNDTQQERSINVCVRVCLHNCLS